MAKNRGTEFEDKIKEAFERQPNTCVLRLYNNMQFHSGVNNPCDYIAYKYPTMYAIECKSTHDSTLNFKSDIRENQWNDLLKLSRVKGIIAGYMVWFIKFDKTIFVDAKTMLELKNSGQKSLNVNKLPSSHIAIEGTKKRIYYDYDLTSFIEKTSEN